MIEWGWEDEVDLTSLNKESNENKLTLETPNVSNQDLKEEYLDDENEDLVSLEHSENDSFFSENEDNEVDLIGLSNSKDLIFHGQRKVEKKLEKEKSLSRKSNLSEEQRFGHKGSSLNADEVGIFHNNNQHSLYNTGLGISSGSIDLIEDEEVKVEIDKKIGALGQSQVLNSMSEQIMISDGLSVADMIRLRRNKKKSNIEKSIEEAKINQIKKNLDNPSYLKSFKEAQERTLSKLNSNGINKDAKHTTGKRVSEIPEGKYISKLRSGRGYTNLLKTLDMNTEELMEVLSKDESELSKKDKERLLSRGMNTPIYNGSIRNKNGNPVRGAQRPTLTFGDYELLDFVYRFEYCGLRAISIGLGRNLDKVVRQVDKLLKMGCLKEQQIIGMKYVYYISPAGYVMLTGDVMKKPLGKVGESLISNKAITNFVGAILYSGCQDLLNLKEGEVKNRYFRGNYYKGETIIPEKVYKSAIGVLTSQDSNPFSSSGLSIGNRRNQIGGSLANKLWTEWKLTGKAKGEPTPDEVYGNEFMYVLYPNNIRDVNSVMPDLVVKRDRNSDGSPNNIAIEIERLNRKEEYYIDRLRAYLQDDRIYGKVVYIITEKRVAQKLVNAKEFLKSRNFPDIDKKISIVVLRDEHGNMLKGITDMWSLV